MECGRQCVDEVWTTVLHYQHLRVDGGAWTIECGRRSVDDGVWMTVLHDQHLFVDETIWTMERGRQHCMTSRCVPDKMRAVRRAQQRWIPQRLCVRHEVWRIERGRRGVDDNDA